MHKLEIKFFFGRINSLRGDKKFWQWNFFGFLEKDRKFFRILCQNLLLKQQNFRNFRNFSRKIHETFITIFEVFF